MPRILIVEDDPVMRKLLAKAMEPMGVDALYASDGLYALDVLRCNPGIDLILTDISMSILDGRQLINMVRTDPQFDRVPILIMSGVVGMAEIADLLDAGASKFIPKPFNMANLREDIATELDLPLPAVTA